MVTGSISLGQNTKKLHFPPGSRNEPTGELRSLGGEPNVVGYRFTPTQELQRRPFYLNISLKMAYFEALGGVVKQCSHSAVTVWVKLSDGF